MTPAAIARVVHEALRADRHELGEPPLPAWDDAPDWQRAATLAAVRFRLANPDAGPAAQHDAWLADKRAAGWTHGTLRDAEARTHPAMVPYDALPECERRKDGLVAAVVRALADTGERAEGE